MTKKLLFWIGLGLGGFGSASAQHLGLRQILEVFNAPIERRAIILQANSFDFRGSSTIANTTCYRYHRVQPDVFGDKYEESFLYCATGTLTYATYSPDHAWNLKKQMEQLEFVNEGPFTTAQGLLKNRYTKRMPALLRVETSNTKDSKKEELWLFQFYYHYETPPPPPPPSPPIGFEIRGKFYALLIGVDKYNKDRSLDFLKFPVQDAMRLKNVLVDRYMFSEKTVTVLTNPDRTTILKTLDKLSYELKKEDKLLIFFAGHGRRIPKIHQGYWLPANAKEDDDAEWISNSTLRDKLGTFSCDHILVIPDACFSGELLVNTRGPQNAAKSIPDLYALPSRRAITSADTTVTSDRSVFLDFLVKKLSANTDKYLTASELYNRLKEPVANNTPSKQEPKYGPIQVTGDQGGDFIFVLKQP